MGMIYAPPSIIQNGALINDVCHIYQSSKPTARPDGSALVIGDKWYNTVTGVEGFWNGTYWLGSSVHKYSSTYVETGTTSPGAFQMLESQYPVFVEYLSIRFSITGSLNANQYAYVELIDLNNINITTRFDIFAGDNLATTGAIIKTWTINSFFFGSNNFVGIAILLRRTGATPTGVGSFFGMSPMLQYRWVL